MEPKSLKSIKKINMGFDVSTKKTGYAIILDGQPFILKNNTPTIGSFKMNQGKEKFETMGDKFNDAHKAITSLSNVIFQVMEPLNTLHKGSNGKFKVDKINVVFELSGIPNGGKFGINVNSMEKLAVYTGAVANAILTVIKLAGFHFMENITVKFVKHMEWAARLWNKQDGDSKELSIAAANKLLNKWGIENTTDDDLADALNMTMIAEQLRDNAWAKSRALQNKHNKYKLPKRINALKELIHNLRIRTYDREMKRKHPRHEMINSSSWIEILRNQEKIKYNKWNKEMNDKVEQLRIIKNERVIKKNV